MLTRISFVVVVAVLLSASCAFCVTINSITVSGNQLTIAGLGFTRNRGSKFTWFSGTPKSTFLTDPSICG